MGLILRKFELIPFYYSNKGIIEEAIWNAIIISNEN